MDASRGQPEHRNAAPLQWSGVGTAVTPGRPGSSPTRDGCATGFERRRKPSRPAAMRCAGRRAAWAVLSALLALPACQPKPAGPVQPPPIRPVFSTSPTAPGTRPLTPDPATVTSTTEPVRQLDRATTQATTPSQPAP